MTNEDTDELYQTVLDLSDAFDRNFIELGQRLRQLKLMDGKRFTDLVQSSNLGARKAYYLVAMDETFSKFRVPKQVLAEVGWTKLMIIEPVASKTNIKDLLAFAKDHTVAELKQFVRGAIAPEKRLKSILLSLSEEDYDTLMEGLVKYGAEKAGRGYVNKEEALIKLVKAHLQGKRG